MQVCGMMTSDGEHIICTQCLAKFTAMGCTNAMRLAGKINKTMVLCGLYSHQSGHEIRQYCQTCHAVHESQVHAQSWQFSH